MSLSFINLNLVYIKCRHYFWLVVCFLSECYLCINKSSIILDFSERHRELNQDLAHTWQMYHGLIYSPNPSEGQGYWQNILDVVQQYNTCLNNAHSFRVSSQYHISPSQLNKKSPRENSDYKRQEIGLYLNLAKFWLWARNLHSLLLIFLNP